MNQTSVQLHIYEYYYQNIKNLIFSLNKCEMFVIIPKVMPIDTING